MILFLEFSILRSGMFLSLCFSMRCNQHYDIGLAFRASDNVAQL